MTFNTISGDPRVSWCLDTHDLTRGVLGLYIIRDLGVYIDSDIGAATHVRRTVSRCIAACVNFDTYADTSPTTAFVLSLFRWSTPGSTTATSCRASCVDLQRRLQAVLNAAARLVFRLRRYDHVTRDTALVACAGTSQFQAGVDGVPCAERYGAVVPEPTCSSIQPYWSSPSTVVFHTAAARPVIPSVNSRPLLVSGRSLNVLEHSARWHSVRTISFCLL